MIAGLSNETLGWITFSIISGWSIAQGWFIAERITAKITG
jgi:hypothetical protein